MTTLYKYSFTTNTGLDLETVDIVCGKNDEETKGMIKAPLGGWKSNTMIYVKRTEGGYRIEDASAAAIVSQLSSNFYNKITGQTFESPEEYAEAIEGQPSAECWWIKVPFEIKNNISVHGHIFGADDKVNISVGKNSFVHTYLWKNVTEVVGGKSVVSSYILSLLLILVHDFHVDGNEMILETSDYPEYTSKEIPVSQFKFASVVGYRNVEDNNGTIDLTLNDYTFDYVQDPTTHLYSLPQNKRIYSAYALAATDADGIEVGECCPAITYNDNVFKLALNAVEGIKNNNIITADGADATFVGYGFYIGRYWSYTANDVIQNLNGYEVNVDSVYPDENDKIRGVQHFVQRYNITNINDYFAVKAIASIDIKQAYPTFDHFECTARINKLNNGDKILLVAKDVNGNDVDLVGLTPETHNLLFTSAMAAVDKSQIVITYVGPQELVVSEDIQLHIE